MYIFKTILEEVGGGRGASLFVIFTDAVSPFLADLASSRSPGQKMGRYRHTLRKEGDPQADKQARTCPCHMVSHPPKFRQRGTQRQVSSEVATQSACTAQAGVKDAWAEGRRRQGPGLSLQDPWAERCWAGTHVFLCFGFFILKIADLRCVVSLAVTGFWGRGSHSSCKTVR